MRGLNRVLKTVVVLIALVSVTKTYAATQFAPAKNYPVGINPKAVLIADFNEDRKLDIAVANRLLNLTRSTTVMCWAM